jgi:H+/gluconate symporter-like permease
VSAVGFALIAVFLLFTALMYLKRISAMLALPLMALLLAMIANVPRQYILKNILEECANPVIQALMATIFGGMLALFIKNQGIATVFVRYAAELGGERPVAVAISLMLATAVLFTTLSGLGAVIMVGTIILPIMLSLGITPMTAAGVMLLGISMGGCLNISNWQLYISVLKVPITKVQNFALVMAALHLVAGLIFCIWSLRRSQLRRFWPAPNAVASDETPRVRTQPAIRRLALLTPVVPLLLVLIPGLLEIVQTDFDLPNRLDLPKWPIVPAFIAGLLFALLTANAEGEMALVSLSILFFNIWLFTKIAPASFQTHVGIETSVLKAAIGGFAAIVLFLLWEVFAWIDAIRMRRSKRWRLALLAPFVALFIHHLLHWPPLSGFFIGALLALVVTVRRDTVQVFTKSVLESFESVAPAVILIIGIGMLLNSVQHENIKNALQPFLMALASQSGLFFAVIFTLLAPLALYRGPLNIWGMGTGVAAILLTTGAMQPEAIMAMLISVGAMQSVCDPTNTANVWIANFAKVDTVDILKTMLVYVWPMIVVALAIAAVMYF